jgi:hypothetical protein
VDAVFLSEIAIFVEKAVLTDLREIGEMPGG